jgi:ribokinase
MPQKILVIGSSNIDFIFKVRRFPNPGETIQAAIFATAFGGKGANQAVAAKRLGGKVSFITKLGKDPFGQAYRRYLIANELKARLLLQDSKLFTGVACIELDTQGENRIIISSGANSALSLKDLQSLRRMWGEARVLVTQLEIPLPTVEGALKIAKVKGIITLLNPSPPRPLSPKLCSMVDFLVPNEWEAQSLTGIQMKGSQDLPRMAQRLLLQGVKNVVITLGHQGLFFKNKQEEIWMKAFPVKVKDTTGAGDAFMGGLAYGLAGGDPIRKVLRLANGAGALATTKLGAQPSLPSKRELQKFLSQPSLSQYPGE